MRNLYPLSAQGEVADDLARAAAYSEANRAPGGVGWTDVHLIREPADSYLARGLLLADVAAALAPIMPRIRRFYATGLAAIGREERDPWGSYEEDAWCFGFGRRCFVKVEPEGERVRAIWFDLCVGPATDAAAMERSLRAIDALCPSFIADYFLETETAIADQPALSAYLQELSGTDLE